MSFFHEGFLMALPSPPSSSHDSSVAVGVAITAVAGVAVAAAVGGSLLYSRSAGLPARRYGLAGDSYHLSVCGRQGIEPSIRAEVWPFLLGFYELESTGAEREAEKYRKREVYGDLRKQCNCLRVKINEESCESEERTGSVENGSEESSSGPSNFQKKPATKVPPPVLATEGDESAELDSSSENTEGDCKEKHARRENGHPLNKCEHSDIKDSCLKATEDFITWHRIIRLDAVRMNAEWVPYSPSQASVTEEESSELATSVGLKDDEHLEPCRQHHAARLVAILEAYALYDPETGYCQGMSDLLSPFVALLDDDYEAFWCFAQFMNTARHNFRLDEIGIRRQLNKVSNILKAGDSHLYSHLEKIHAEDCTFVYRMIVVLMRRELTFEQTISLWEVIWAEKRAVGTGRSKTSWRKARRKNLLNNDLLLYVIAASVRQRKKIIIQRCRGMDDLLRECNSMAGHLDVWMLLDDARDLVSAVRGRISD